MDPYRKQDLDIVGQIQPLWFYKRLDTATAGVATLPQYALFTVPYGFNYLARRIATQWDARNVPLTIINPEARVEVYNRAQSRARQSGSRVDPATGFRERYAEIPLDVISSPGGAEIVANAAPAPVDATAFSVNFTAAPVKSMKIVNLIFPYNDTIEARIVGAPTAGALAMRFPSYVDVLVMGYLIPERALAMWEGGNNG